MERFVNEVAEPGVARRAKPGGAEGDRTPDLLTASFELSVVFIELKGLTVGKMRQIAEK